jgi:hypothetical protein
MKTKSNDEYQAITITESRSAGEPLHYLAADREPFALKLQSGAMPRVRKVAKRENRSVEQRLLRGGGILSGTRVMLLVICLMGMHIAVDAQQTDSQTVTPTQTDAGAVMSAYEREQIRLEEAKLALEREKSWITGGSIAVPLVVAILAYLSAHRNQKKLATENFQLKAAEIAMAARNAYDAKGKAIALAALFPQKLSKLGEQFERFDAEKYNWGRESKKELLSLIAANADHRRIIVKAWKSLFPHDKWINQLPEDL